MLCAQGALACAWDEVAQPTCVEGVGASPCVEQEGASPCSRRRWYQPTVWKEAALAQGRMLS